MSKTPEEMKEFIYDERDRLMASERKNDDSTKIVWDLLCENNLDRGIMFFNNFEIPREKLIGFAVHPDGAGLIDGIVGLSKTTDGSFMVLGGDFSQYSDKFLELIEIFNEAKDQFGLENAIFFTKDSDSAIFIGDAENIADKWL